MTKIENLKKNISKVITGKEEVVDDILKVILSKGHILIEDVPGTGKTTLIKTLAKSIDLQYSRVQCTPDLLPADITGVSIFNVKTSEFEFRKGPIFSNIVLVDEINRASSKTQSALLEVMEEKQVSEGGVTYKIGNPFIVFATENPIEYDGTFKLPEAQLDRFTMKINMGYPTVDEEVRILKTFSEENPLDYLQKVMTLDDIKELQEKCSKVKIKEELNEYLAIIADTIRKSELISLGASTRAILSLQKVAKANAVIEDRDYVIPDDIKNNVVKVLAHRIKISKQAKAQGLDAKAVVEKLVNTVYPPRIK